MPQSSWILLSLAGASFWVSACTSAEEEEELQSEASTHTLEQSIGGETVEREYTLHTPMNWDTSTELPLFFAFHGGGAQGDYFVEEFNETMQFTPFVGVYPQARDDGWSVAANGEDDVAFVLALLESLRETPGVDSSSPVAYGYSNGAAFVHRLALETDQFSGISAIASQLLRSHQPQPRDPHVSVLQLHGTEDDVIEYEGSRESAEEGEDFLAAEESAAVWAAHNGCSVIPTETPTGAYTRMEWPECSTGTRVVHYRLNGEGHDVPWEVEDDTFATVVNFLMGTRP